MITRIVSSPFTELKDLKEEMDYIKKKDFTNLVVEIELREQELYELIENVIEQDTQIDLLEYDINLIDYKTLEKALNHIENEDEQKYIKETLCEQYSVGVMNNTIEYIINSLCNPSETFTNEFYSIEEERYVNFYIEIDNFVEYSSRLIKNIDRLFN